MARRVSCSNRSWSTRSVRSIAKFTPARSSVSSVFAAQVRKSSAARCSASIADHRRTRPARRRNDRSDIAARGDGSRRQSGLRRSGRRIDRAEPDRPREPVPQSGRRGPSPVLYARAGSRKPSRFGPRSAGGREAKRSDAADRAPVRRQSAEGRGRALAASRRQGLCVRGSDRRASMSAPRRRSTGCSTWLSQAGAAIVIVSTDFEEVAKVCHRALVFDRGRVVAELAAADLSVENLLAAASASIGHSARSGGHRFHRPGPGRPCSPLNPTRSSRHGRNLAVLSRWRAIGRLAPVYGLPILTILLIVFFSLLLPDTFPTALNLRSILSRQGDHRAAVAGSDIADDGRPHRPHRRLRHRHVAHPGDEPAGQVRRPVAGCHSDRRRLRSAGRPAQRPSGRGRADQFVHRHARHRHDPVRARALAHRRAPDHRPAAAGLHRYQHDVDRRHSDSRRLRDSSWPSLSGSSASGCRSVGTSTRSAPTRKRPH